jgi:hypothetical protein
MTRDDNYKLVILIVALCMITWMFWSDAWGADPKERIGRERRSAAPAAHSCRARFHMPSTAEGLPVELANTCSRRVYD